MARGKGKKGINRGSGRRFAAESAEEIEQRNARLAAFDEQRARHRKEDEPEKDIEDDDMEDRLNAERKAMEELRISKQTPDTKQSKSKGLESIIDVQNPNRSKQVEVQDGMSRKEREQAQQAAAAAAYRLKHEQGLTEEYKRDMAKLAEVKKRRQEAEAKHKAEKELQEQQEQLKRQAHQQEERKSKSSKETIPKLDKIKVKKMKPSQLKEALKLRNLSIQGNAKQLTERLLEYEKNR